MGRRRRRRSAPQVDTAKLIADANEKARQDAEKARLDNQKMIAAMQAKADAERKRAEAIARTPGATKVGATMASAEQGLSSKKQGEKRKRAKRASDLRIALAPAASPMGLGATQQGQPTIG